MHFTNYIVVFTSLSSLLISCAADMEGAPAGQDEKTDTLCNASYENMRVSGPELALAPDNGEISYEGITEVTSKTATQSKVTTESLIFDVNPSGVLSIWVDKPFDEFRTTLGFNVSYRGAGATEWIDLILDTDNSPQDTTDNFNSIELNFDDNIAAFSWERQCSTWDYSDTASISFGPDEIAEVRVRVFALSSRASLIDEYDYILAARFD